jgi:GNAT superfamily N-acetyltransferase
MHLNLAIRSAQTNEHAALLPLFEELDEHHRRVRPDIFCKPLGTRREATMLDALIAGPDSTILVAEDPHGTLHGLAVLLVRDIPGSPIRHSRRFVEIDNFVVRPASRRHHIGNALLAASRAWAVARNIGRIELSVWAFNSEAIALYRNAGFASTILRMELPLAETGHQ